MDGWTNEEKQAYQSTTINGKMSAKLYKRTVKWKKKKLKRLAKLMLKKNNKSKLYNTLENYFKEKFLLYDDGNQGFLKRKEFSKLII